MALIVGNWKMHLGVPESSILVERLSKKVENKRNEIVLCPSYPAIFTLAKDIKDRGWDGMFKLGAQDLNDHDEGAYTGEVSAAQLKQFVDYCIIGHSERRANYAESDDLIAKKVAAALRHDIIPILCVGETAAEKEANQSLAKVQNQLNADLAEITPEDAADLVIAYEPVWAISTEQHITPDAANIEKMLGSIYLILAATYGDKLAEQIPILYGGSVDETNAAHYLALERCNGLLVGGASINYEKFGSIANA